MYLEIVTPDRNVFAGAVSSASFPGSEGYFQVLNNHAPLVSSLGKGTLSFREEKGNETSMEVEGGVVEVHKNRITVLVEAIME